MSKLNYKNYIANVADFPIPGILFRDITPLMADGEAFSQACQEIIDFARRKEAMVVAGPESRGFIFGCPVSCALSIGFVPVRKPNKLPREVVTQSYDLEYGSNTLCIHKDAIKKGQKVVIIDDLLATGGTAKATIDLIEKLGGEIVGLAFLIELTELKGRSLLEGYDIFTIMSY